MSNLTKIKRISHLNLRKMQKTGEKIAALTAYDSSLAKICDLAGVDCIIVGDSLGMVVQGQSSTTSVSMNDIKYHTEIVYRSTNRPLIMSDMPFGSYQLSPRDAYINAVELLKVGAQMVKIEGGFEMVDTTKFLSERGVPVCAHIGLTPQHINRLGGYFIHGKTEKSKQNLIKIALAHQQAGADIILIELVLESVGKNITAMLDIPTIGIGAGRFCDGQVLVIYDMLGITQGKKPRFVHDFLAENNSVLSAVKSYVSAVKNETYPDINKTYQ